MIAVIVLLVGATTAGAEQIVNGGFELPSLPVGTDFVGVTGDFITGWTIPDSWTIDLVRDYWPAFQGSQSIDLDGNSGIGATILQSFATVPGHRYSLSFAYANNTDASTATGRVQVLGTTTLLDTTLTHSGSTGDDMNYLTYARRFTADSQQTTLQFTHVWSPHFGQGLALDAVSVTSTGTGACCFPSGACLEGPMEDCVAAGGTYVGDGVPCEPDPCGSTPVKDATWGGVKSVFR
jgi:choice-of-anchor C domain-containing protein